jgi:hypothetical protein
VNQLASVGPWVSVCPSDQRCATQFPCSCLSTRSRTRGYFMDDIRSERCSDPRLPHRRPGTIANPKRECSQSVRFHAHAESRRYSFVSFRILLCHLISQPKILLRSFGWCGRMCRQPAWGLTSSSVLSRTTQRRELSPNYPLRFAHDLPPISIRIVSWQL